MAFINFYQRMKKNEFILIKKKRLNKLLFLFTNHCLLKIEKETICWFTAKN